MVDTESDQYKKPINDKGYSEGLTPYENNYTSSQITPNSLTPSSSTNINNYTPMKEVNNGITKFEAKPLYMGGQSSKNNLYVSGFCLIGFNILDIIFYCSGILNIFLIFDTLISLASSLYLLYCLIKNKDLKLAKSDLIFSIAFIALVPRMHGFILELKKLSSQNNDNILFPLMGIFNFTYKVIFYLIFIHCTCLS